MDTESGLNRVTKPVPGVVPSLRGILLRSRCHAFYAVFGIKKFFCSVRISDRDSYLRIVCVPSPFFSATPSPTPSWTFYCDCAIPFGDSASGDYAACPKAATVLTHLSNVPLQLQETVCQALINVTDVDDGGVGADSPKLLSELQVKIGKILKERDFHIKAWESSGEEGSSKYLGMTWNREDNRYLLKFRLNLYQKVCGIPSGENLDSEFLQDKSVPITKKNVLSGACQFYDPNGLAAPLMFPVRDRQCNMQTPLSADRADRSSVEEILKTKMMSFPTVRVINIGIEPTAHQRLLHFQIKKMFQ